MQPCGSQFAKLLSDVTLRSDCGQHLAPMFIAVSLFTKEELMVFSQTHFKDVETEAQVYLTLCHLTQCSPSWSLGKQQIIFIVIKSLLSSS